jgi:hypothetical protein
MANTVVVRGSKYHRGIGDARSLEYTTLPLVEYCDRKTMPTNAASLTR